MLSYKNWLLNESHMSDTNKWTDSEHEQFNDLRLKNLVDTCALCDKHKVRYYIDAGTLLGLYRDKQMISGDSDNDIAIMAEDITPEFLAEISRYCNEPDAAGSFFLSETLPDLEKDAYVVPKSLKYHNMVGNTKRRMTYKGKYIWTDLFILYPHEDYHLFKLGATYYRIPNKFLGKRGTLTHKGHKFKTPTNVEEYLEHVFGKGWVSPDPDYVSSEQNKGFYVIEIDKHGPYTYNWAEKKGVVK